MSESIDINTLSRETGVNIRTVRYYLAEGLLPPPRGRGPAASYAAGHRDRLLLIRRLQEAHQPLAAIRAQLEALDDAGVAAALTLGEPPPAPTSAYDYVKQVLRAEPPAPAPPTLRAGLDGAASPRRAPPRSTWERITLHPDLELHVRRPLARADQRRLDELLDHARRLFPGDL